MAISRTRSFSIKSFDAVDLAGIPPVLTGRLSTFNKGMFMGRFTTQSPPGLSSDMARHKIENKSSN